MRILRGLASYPPDLRPCVTALGAFDGIHLGHALLISTAVERGRALGLPSVVCTFDPHPATVLWPERAPRPIATLDDNLERMKGLGADAALIIPFTLEFSRMEAEAFVDDILVRTLGAREVVVGFNHTFGHDALGTAAPLAALAPRRGFTARVLPPLRLHGPTVSSGAIPHPLGDGCAAATAGNARRSASRCLQVCDGVLTCLRRCTGRPCARSGGGWAGWRARGGGPLGGERP